MYTLHIAPADLDTEVRGIAVETSYVVVTTTDGDCTQYFTVVENTAWLKSSYMMQDIKSIHCNFIVAYPGQLYGLLLFL